MRWFAGWLYALGMMALAAGVVIYATNIPNIPEEEDLIRVRGFLDGIVLKKDSDATDIVYLRLRDHDTRYKYLSIYPHYVEIRDRLGIYREVDLLVRNDAVAGLDGAVRVWGLVEHDPFGPGTVVTFDEIRDEVTQTERSWQTIAICLLAGALAALALGYTIRRLVPHVPKDPVA